MDFDAGLELAQAYRSICGEVIDGGQSNAALALGRAPVIDAANATVFVIATWAGTYRVERGSPGLRIGERIETTGLRSVAIARLHFDERELPVECRIGDEGTFALIRRRQRACSTAVAVGLLGALVEACTIAARERRVGQATRAVLADLRIRSEVCRRVQARARAQAEYELAIATAMLGEQLASVAHVAMHRFAEPLGSPGPIDRLANAASTLARLLDDPERVRTEVAASLLGFGGAAP
jgi:alkylation response protein AidB-like acyl-CoA dehydrogenase